MTLLPPSPVHRQPKLARRFVDRFEPVHQVVYFAPEARAALDGLGYRGYWMGYFAARSAPLGAVAPQVVTAIFYNFAPERVAKALPAAWQIAGPEAALRARQESAVAALQRYGLVADENVTVAAELAERAARGLSVDGRPLFGRSKTIRGVVLAVLVTMAGAPLIGLGWEIGLLVGTLAMTGDLVSSFLKRRLDMPPGSRASGLDQVPEALFPLLACRNLLSLTMADMAAGVALFFIGEVVLSRVLYTFRLRDRPY